MSDRATVIMIASLAGVAALASSGCSAAPPGISHQHATDEARLISPNRPTFSDGATLVPRHYVQFETGWTLAHRDDAGATSERHNAPEMVGRYRLFDSLEVRASWGGYVSAATGGAKSPSTEEGAADPALAVLVPIVDQDGLRPTLVLEVASTIGIGDETLTSGHADPTVKLLWSYGGGALPEWLTVGGNLIASYPTESGDRFSQTAASLYATASAADAGTSIFAEWYVVSPYSNEFEAAHSVDAGVVQRLGRTTAVDARVGLGLDSQADDWFTGLGFSVMF